MGQATRQVKYAKFWSWVGHSNASDEFSAAIDILLRILTDDQLDQVLADLEIADGFTESSDTS